MAEIIRDDIDFSSYLTMTEPRSKVRAASSERVRRNEERARHALQHRCVEFGPFNMAREAKPQRTVVADQEAAALATGRARHHVNDRHLLKFARSLLALANVRAQMRRADRLVDDQAQPSVVESLFDFRDRSLARLLHHDVPFHGFSPVMRRPRRVWVAAWWPAMRSQAQGVR